ncbi:hypothetical protein ACPCHT_09055 [Nucisporomicrobium flavum]|uniref:hypothetical protein n=1 Tax=Nucisporomicrobium flavum TaxID=2785915 RepID=UPI003C2FB8FA
MTSEELEAIADAFNDLFKLLRDADPRDKVELYSRMGLGPTCQPANARLARFRLVRHLSNVARGSCWTR